MNNKLSIVEHSRGYWLNERDNYNRDYFKKIAAINEMLEYSDPEHIKYLEDYKRISEEERLFFMENINYKLSRFIK